MEQQEKVEKRLYDRSFIWLVKTDFHRDFKVVQEHELGSYGTHLVLYLWQIDQKRITVTWYLRSQIETARRERHVIEKQKLNSTQLRMK